MASQFIGYNVLVTLKASPNATLQGQVANVIGQRLILQNGMRGSPMITATVCLLIWLMSSSIAFVE